MSASDGELAGRRAPDGRANHEPVPDGHMASALRENIARLSHRQRAERHAAPISERIAGSISAFAGSMRFVVLHLVLFGGWIVVNLGWVQVLPRFDPSFVVLAMIASVEAIFLSTFVLITQNRMSDAADRRADLDLHVNLLTEHELTKLAGLVQQIAEKLNIDVADPQIEEITRDIEATDVLDALDESRQASTPDPRR